MTLAGLHPEMLLRLVLATVPAPVWGADEVLHAEFVTVPVPEAKASRDGGVGDTGGPHSYGPRCPRCRGTSHPSSAPGSEPDASTTGSQR